ncbi:MAG: hypothetical protein B0D92_07990 [Spirochaeta sp. LUC14_002_19_P3]|nr:MAG: hypothetical protein B0D92_07990 [Spirochaeta sp. LUC14_002_19_P3]
MAINELAAGSLEAHLATMNTESFNETADIFVEKLNALGFNAEKIDSAITLDPVDNKISSSNKKKYYSFDFNSIPNSQQYDEIIFLYLEKAGSIRAYYGFIPTTPPNGYSKVSGMLVKVSDSELLWLAEQEEIVKVDKLWEQPPDYPNVTLVVEEAIESAKNYLIDNFFSQD